MSLFSTRLPTIQARISALVVACVLPTALAATLLLYRDFVMERASVERSTVDTARALHQLIDRELSGAEATLRVLSTSPHLKSGDLKSLYGQAEEILQNTDGAGDVAFVLCDANGQQLLNTLKPYGTALPQHGDAAHFSDLKLVAQPVISELFTGGVATQPLVAVEMAIPAPSRGNRPVYILSLEFLSGRFAEILERQHLPAGQIIALLDRNGAVVAHAPQAQHLAGTRIAPALMEHMKSAGEGTVETDVLGNSTSLIAFSRSALSNWTLFIGMPREAITGGLWESVSLVAAGTLLLLALGLMLAKFIGDRISRSIKGLVKPALALGHGQVVTVPPLLLREADDVGQALVKAARLIEQRTAERDFAKQTVKQLGEVTQKFEYQACHDELTGLGNRMLFNQLIKSGIESCAAHGDRLIVFYIDVDDLKAVNDRYGHMVGDDLLRQFAARLKGGLREFDVTARLGGDEFAAILLHANPTYAEATAHSLIDTLSRPYQIGELTVSTSASIGVAGYPDSATTTEDLLRRADLAMYRAKNNGKRRCVLYDQSMDQERA
ncbi:MAG: GGDEF domain-containing protein [Burkholderiaceae bacterium]|nr:GGDEF domain-containing protein [Burkholderiaceae bacterium]